MIVAPLAATRAVVRWEGPGQPVMLILHGPDGEAALPLLPKRALTLAQELLTRGVQAIKADPRRPHGHPNERGSGCRIWGGGSLNHSRKMRP